MNTRYLKAPNPPTTEATEELRDRVSEILKDIERGGLDAVRRYSQELDSWAPADFVVSDAEFERAAAQIDDRQGAHRLRPEPDPRRLPPPSWARSASWRSRSGTGWCSATG